MLRAAYIVVAGFFILITLLIGLGLGLIGGTLFLTQGLPAFSEDLANLTYKRIGISPVHGLDKNALPKLMPGFSSRTVSRCSLAKNMYAERLRLGALGSVSNLAHVIRPRPCRVRTLLLLAVGSLGLGLSGGSFFLGHDQDLDLYGVASAMLVRTLSKEAMMVVLSSVSAIL